MINGRRKQAKKESGCQLSVIREGGRKKEEREGEKIPTQ